MNTCDPLSRRAFLKTTAIAATATGLGRRLGAAFVSAQRKVVVGAHPWVYAATQPNYEITPVLPQIFADFSYAGVGGIELMHTALKPDDAVARIGELSLQHKLPVIGTSFSGAMWNREQHQAVLENAELVITRIAQLGGRTLGTSVGQLRAATPKPRKTPEQLDAQADCLRKMIALCTRHGVVLNLHNHTYEVENDLHDLKGTLARIPDVKLGPDLNWLVRGGVDSAAFIRQYGKQIVFLHLRDQRKDGRWVEAMGEGDTDFGAIAAALREVGFSGDAVIELAHERDFKPTRPLRESVKRSRDFVRRTLGY
ncbi:MAG: sugar phosphate isomerase/epimerase [Verrucomicrobia bacterium]|nr:sugar phosphate isomerase/epimerase [Verrucomicrobiota bacterium]